MAAPHEVSESKLTAPFDWFEDVTPANSGSPYGSNPPRGIYVGVTGDVQLCRSDDVLVVFKNAQAGSTVPGRPKRVNAALTTATNLIAVW